MVMILVMMLRLEGNKVDKDDYKLASIASICVICKNDGNGAVPMTSQPEKYHDL